MNRFFVLSCFLLMAFVLIAQEEYKSIDYKNYRKALDVFTLLENTNYNQIDSLHYNLSGTYYFFGHLPNPRQRKPYPMHVEIQWNGTVSFSENKLIVGNDTIFRKEYLEDGIIMVPDDQRGLSLPKRINDESYLPFYSSVSVYHDILKNKNSIRYLGYDDLSGCEVIIYSSPFAGQATVYINKEKHRIESVSLLKYENVEGDYYLQFIYDSYTRMQSFEVPLKVVVKEWNEVKYEFVCEYESIISSTDSIEPAFSLISLAKNLYKITYPTNRHYSYLVDFGDYLGLIEAPVNESYMQELSGFVLNNISDKPIKYCFLTHHHPDHAGGFSYFYNNQATVVTTELSCIYQQELLEREYSLNNDKIIYSGKGEFDVVHKNERRYYGKNGVKMEALEFSDNGHTSEFLLYYFPASEILIAGDLYYVKNDEVTASERANKLYDFIKKNRLKVKYLYPTWMPSSARYATIQDLKISAEKFNKLE